MGKTLVLAADQSAGAGSENVPSLFVKTASSMDIGEASLNGGLQWTPDTSSGVYIWPGAQSTPSLEQKAKLVLLALIRHVDENGHAHITEAEEDIYADDDNSLTTHTIRPEEEFGEWVNRMYQAICVVRGEPSA